MSTAKQQAAAAPAQGEEKRPGKKKIKVTVNENGHPVEKEEWVDDLGVIAWIPAAEAQVLHRPIPRVDGPEKVSGRARYTHDVRLPGMVWARLLLAPAPKGKITKLDLAPALATPGCVAAIAIDAEGFDYLGAPIAAVAATSSERAEDALRAIVLEYERGPFVLDHASATKSGAPRVAKKEDKAREEGDLSAAESVLAACAATIEGVYEVPIQHHACLETHGVVVDYRGGDEATVYISTQSVSQGVADAAAEELGLAKSKVTAIVEHMGGGFGGKFGLGLEGQVACQLAKQVKRPVHLMLTRKDEFLTGGNRSGARMEIKLGADAEGTLLSMVSRRYRHGGVGEGSLTRHPYVYEVGPRDPADAAKRKPASFSSTVSVRTHMDANRAMRAPGHPQASFGMESALDELVTKLGLDAVEVRKRNLRADPWHKLFDAAAAEIGWAAHPHRTAPGAPQDGVESIGIGFGVSVWGGGGSGGSLVDVRVERDGSVTASVGSQDLGTGTRTYVAAIPAEELGLPVSAVTARIGSTRYGFSQGSGGSVTTASLAPAVKDAAVKARVALAERVASTLGCAPELVRFAGGKVFDATSPSKSLGWKQACALLPSEGVEVRGTWRSELQASGASCVQAARVAVDTGTGRLRVLHMVSVHATGLVLNPLAFKSQVQGGMVQALGYALTEERVVDAQAGLHLNANLEEYKLPHSLEIPRMSVITHEDGRGVLGIGEPPIIPGASAIANALANACGARVRSLPLTPDKVLAALGRVG